MRKTALFILFFSFLQTFSFAQTLFKPGYIILNNKDTVYGEIDYQNNVKISKSCTFRKNKNSPSIKYTPKDIKSFRFTNSKYFVSKDIGSTKYFLEYLIKSKMNVYYRLDWDGDHYYIDKDNSSLVELPYVEKIIQDDDGQFMHKSIRHKQLLSLYTEDAPELKKDIQMIDKPSHNNLINLSKKYNNIICDSNKCIVYEKKPFHIKVNPEIRVGSMFRWKKNDEDILFLPNKEISLLGHFWLQSFEQRLFFKTGFTYFINNPANSNYSLHWLIPLAIEYIYPKGIIRPSVSIGTYLPAIGFTNISIGCNIKLTKNMYLSLNMENTFSPITFDGINYLFSEISSGIFLNF